MSDTAVKVQQLNSNRPKFTFKIPESARLLETDPHTVTLQSITIGEENQASASVKSSGGPLGYELVKHSLIAADGKVVSWEAGEKERFLEGCSSKVRTLIMGAFEKIHSPEKKDSDDFFNSMTVAV